MPAGSARQVDAQVAVIGAGPIGLTLAGRLAQHGVRTLLLEQNAGLTGEGSRALCMQRETLEIWQRLGIGEAVAARGIQWRTARTYFGERELFSIRLPGGSADHFPPFVNISQSEVEHLLLERIQEIPTLEIRWKHRLTGIVQGAEGVDLRCAAPAGETLLRADFAVGTDGAHSSVRHLLGMGFGGHSHEDLFLICDLRAELPFPRERRLFFDPPWNPGRQVLVHPQPDGVWRIDWQVPPETDVEAERADGRLDRRIRAVIGRDTPYQLVWLTAYRFHQRMVERFRLGRVLLAGDAAHLMSPFGARGLNSGAADAENLAWKLATVVRGDASADLLETYDAERRAAAAENLAVTDRTMRFMVPHGPLRRAARDAVLRGSLRVAWLRRLVNSGRLAEPSVYAGSPVVAVGEPLPRGATPLGSVAPDFACERIGSPRQPVRRVRELLGEDFVVLLVMAGDPATACSAAVRASRLSYPARVRVVAVGPDRALRDVVVLRAADRAALGPYVAAGPRGWVVRPDGHLAASAALHEPADVDQLASLVALAIGAHEPSVEPAATRIARRRAHPRRAT
jgi:2-polyprenyl-6-methoxyphenol hydroxylase-like FAD-dependent oxidoreductase